MILIEEAFLLDLTRLMQNSNSIRIVTILDCCYSGAAKISKGLEDAAAKVGTAAIQDKARILERRKVKENVSYLQVKLHKKLMD